MVSESDTLHMGNNSQPHIELPHLYIYIYEFILSSGSVKLTFAVSL